LQVEGGKIGGKGEGSSDAALADGRGPREPREKIPTSWNPHVTRGEKELNVFQTWDQLGTAQVK